MVLVNISGRNVGYLAGTVRWICLLFVCFSLFGCAGLQEPGGRVETVKPVTSQPQPGQGVIPVFTTHRSERSYNRVGTVEAVDGKGGAAVVRVNGNNPVVYNTTAVFRTEKEQYRNAIYRVHFEKTPFSLLPFYLTAGKHPGLIVVLTHDREGRVVLVTTVHTCGCYVASVPTGWLRAEALPADWPDEVIKVYGEELPARLPKVTAGQAIDIVIRPDTHRVMGITVVEQNDLVSRHLSAAPVRSLESLRHLETHEGKTISFYYRAWPLTGHVRGAVKWWEMLMLSVPSLDLFVGMDKDFGSTEQTGNPFYTSLQPWYRSASDMNDFAGFLHYHGWNL